MVACGKIDFKQKKMKLNPVDRHAGENILGICYGVRFVPRTPPPPSQSALCREADINRWGWVGWVGWGMGAEVPLPPSDQRLIPPPPALGLRMG